MKCSRSSRRSLHDRHTVHVRTVAGMLGQVSGCHTKHPWFADPERRVSIGDMMIKTEDTNTWAMMSPEDVLACGAGVQRPACRDYGWRAARCTTRRHRRCSSAPASRCNWRHRARKPFRRIPPHGSRSARSAACRVGDRFWVRLCGAPTRSNTKWANLLSLPVDRVPKQSEGAVHKQAHATGASAYRCKSLSSCDDVRLKNCRMSMFAATTEMVAHSGHFTKTRANRAEAGRRKPLIDFSQGS